MKTIRNLTSLLLGLLLVSCSSRDATDDGNVLHLAPLRATQEVEDLSPYIADLELVRVGSDSTAIPGIAKILYSDPVVFLAGGAVYATTPDFQEIRKVGNSGRGPGEYISVKDIAVSADGNEVWCMDVLNAVLRYDLKTLSYLGKIDFRMDKKEYVRAMIPQEDGTVALYTPNPAGDFPQEGETFHCLTLYDLAGEPVGRQLPWTRFNVMAAFAIPVSPQVTGEYILTPESSPVAYVFNTGGLDHRIEFDFGSKWIPRKFFDPKDGDPAPKVGDLFDRDCFKLIAPVFYAGQDLYFMAFGKDSSRWNFYLSRDGSRGIRWRSVGVATPPICAIASDGAYLLFNYEDYGLVKEERDPLKKCVIQQFGLPQKTGDSYLIKVKLRLL
jgi:hypothetical protein